jgi:hypothetical protein
MTDIRFFQTSDYEHYLPLLRLTERTCMRFCQLNDIPYFQTIGLYKGSMPWHATFNRITYLQELLTADFEGWSIYCDADAYVNDITFPIREFLDANAEKALIVASGLHEHRWAVNAGVLLLNFGNPLGRKIVELWTAEFEGATQGNILQDPATKWSDTFNDQAMLHKILGHNDDILEACLIDDGSLINYSGRFIRQVLRSQLGSMHERLELVASENRRILGHDAKDELLHTSSAVAGVHSPLNSTGGIIMRKRPNLTDLANAYHSDKGTTHGDPPHRYTYLYDLLFAPVRDETIDFLEIGLAIGGPEIGGPIDRVATSPSVQMWLEYFPKARIFGFDISDFAHMTTERFSFIRGDSGKEADLRRLADAALSFDIIIDDASHASYHQQLAFKVLFPKLACGGLYIIEDLHWQSPHYESQLPQVPTTAEFFNALFQQETYIANQLFTPEDTAAIKNLAASFASFPPFGNGHPVTKMIVIRKNGD